MKKIFDEVMNLTEDDLNKAIITAQASFNVMSKALNNDPLELIKFALYKIDAVNNRLEKLIAILEEQKK